MSYIESLQQGQPVKAYDAAAVSVGNSRPLALLAQAQLISWQFSFDVNPSAVSISIQTSLDNIIWNTVVTSTVITGDAGNILTSAVFIRGKVNSATGGLELTLTFVSKIGMIGITNNNISITRTLSIAETQNLGRVPVQIVAGQPGIYLNPVRIVASIKQGTDPYLPADLLQLFVSPTHTNAVSKNLPYFDISSDGWLGLGDATVSGILRYSTNPPDGFLTSDADGQGIYIVLDGSTYITGLVLSTTLNDGGLLYDVGDTGTIGGGNNDATYVVNTVDISGTILTYTITNPGTGYSPQDGYNTSTSGAQPGIGAGFIINVTDIVPTQDGQITVTVFYDMIPLS